MNFDINAARSAGYSDDEIADYLSKENNFDLAGALSSGYTPQEVVGFLSGPSSSGPGITMPESQSTQQPLPDGVQPSQAGGGRGFVNPPMATDPQPVAPRTGFFGRLADSFGTGVEQAKSALSSINVTAQNEALQAKRQQLAQLEAAGRADSPEAASLRTYVDAMSKRQGEYIADLTQQQKVVAQRPTNAGVQKLAQAKTFGEAWSTFAEDPVNIALNLGAQSLPTMAPGLIVGAINPVAGAATIGATSAASEFGSSIIEFAQKNGVDTTSREAVTAFYSNPEMLGEAKKYAATRAGIIGLVDAASGGIASKTLVPSMVKGPVARVATNTGVQMGVQGAAGGAGEAGAQIATEGKITSPGEVVAEIAGEFAGAPLEVAGMRAGVREERAKEAVNFTPANSPTKAAGLPDIVVPIPDRGTANDSAPGPVGQQPAGGGQQPGDLGRTGVEPADAAGVLGPIGDVRPGTDRVDAVAGADGVLADAGVQRAAPVAGDPLRRSADTDLLARAEATQPAPQEQPTTIWTGRAGDGYMTRQDAEVALPTRVKREPDLRWEIERMPSGKFRLAGYAQDAAPAQQEPRAITGQEFMQSPQQAIQTAQQISFAPGQMGAVKVSDRKALNAAFDMQEMDDGSTVFTLRAAPQGQAMDQQAAGSAALQAGRPAGVVPGAGVAPSVSGRATQAGGADPAALTRDLKAIQDSHVKRFGTAVELEPVSAQSSATGLAAAVARIFQAPITFVRAKSGQLRFNGVELNGRLYISEDGESAPVATAMHEVGHTLPQDIKRKMIDGVMATVTPQQRATFLADFSAYAKDSKEKQDEELVMRIIEQDAQNPEFWQRLADRMGDSEFAQLAREILRTLDRIIAGFRKEDSSEFTTDIERVRDLVADAYAEAQARMGQQPDGDANFSGRRKREQIGDFEAASEKDGGLTVLGDPDAIRAQIPEDVKGRVMADGVRFTTSDAQRVRAALEGRQVAYSRAGAVLDKLPMRDGKYLGAPPGFDTPGKIPTLRKMLRQLTNEGEAGRFWYENSSKAVLRMAGGNVQEARRFVALLAIYSPQAKVDTNTTFALRAWAQYRAGQPIKVKTAVMDKKATEAMSDVDAFWSGEKTGNFFFNLLREIDPSTAGKQGATIDMWMMRAGQYPTDAPTKTQYAFMENETNRIASEMGWEPQQVQAAIWVAMKARMENAGVKKRTEDTSEKRGWIRFDTDGKGKKVRVVIDKQKHRDNWLLHAMRHVPSTKDTQTAKFDFEDGLMRHIGQVSFEARPGRTSGSLPGIHSAPYAQQVEFQQAVQAAFTDDTGRDLLAHHLGLMVDSDILAPGVWQGEVSPSTQLSVVMAPNSGAIAKNEVDPAQAKALNIYSAVLGLLTRQEGVGWHRPFYATTKRDANGVEIDVGRPLNPAEASDLERAVGEWMQANGKDGWQDKFAFVSSPRGIRLVNFGIITNETLQSDIIRAAESVLPDFNYRVFASSGDMPTNNWKENPNGESYVQRIRAEGRSDVLDWARGVLAPRVQRVFDDYGQRYGWGDAGRVNFSGQRDGGGRPASAGAADRQDVPGRPAGARRSAGQDQGSAQGLTPLPGAPKVPGFHGPDPRLVAVAEQYARDNGIELRRQSEYVQVDPLRAKRIANAYEVMRHDPQNPKVREAYQNLIQQTRAQYDALVNAGYKFWFIDLEQASNAEYASTPWNAMRDIRANKTMGVFPTEAGFGSGDAIKDNPLETTVMDFTWPSGSLDGSQKRVLANDLFRAVHDAFGHGLEGAGFRAQGEENAWQAHVRLFTGSAVGAITSETRGQNSWLNFGPYGERNQTAQVEDTVFADQKTGLMPEWTWNEGRAGDMPMFSAQRQTETPEFKRWFGDSKVVDADGKPLVVYHGTKSNVSEFRPSRGGEYGVGIYLTPDEGAAWMYADRASGDGGQNIIPVYAAINNPYFAKTRDEVRAIGAKKLQSMGHDGIIATSPNGEVQYIAFRPEQIKSAIGNNGQFDPENPDIRMSANRSPLGLYSALSRAVEAMPTKSSSAGGWKTQIQGLINKGAVKADEVEWSGVNDWLDLQTGKVTKESVLEYLRGNGVQVQEVTLGDPSEADIEMLLNDEAGEGMTREDAIEYLQGAEGASPPKYDRYTLPGGENYREVLLTLPMQFDAIKAEREFSERMQQKYPMSVAARLRAMQPDEIAEWDRLKAQANAQADKNAGYKSSHWDQPNVLAHIRVNDRTDADGRRVLFVEELQSDWGQQAKKEGINKPPMKGEVRPQEGYDAASADEWEPADGPAQTWAVYWEDGTYSGGYATKEEANERLRSAAQSKAGDVPNAPFIGKTDGWLNLALKRVIAMAVDGGYDAVAFVNGDQSAERYDLSKQISKVRYEDASSGGIGNPDMNADEDSGQLYAYNNDGNLVIDKRVKYTELEDYVGKEVASKLLASKPQAVRQYGLGVRRRELSGLDLKVGGEGMKTFYDKIVPNAAKALLKKVGGGSLKMVNVQQTEGFSGNARKAPAKAIQSEQPGFDITDAMREKVSTEGLPMFSARRSQPIQGQRFTLPETDRTDAARIKLQDDALRMRRVIEAVQSQGGTVNEEQNFYDANTLMPGRVQAMMDDFRNDVIKPMIEKAAKAGIDMEELSLYAYAKHAEERNDYIASINPRMPDGGSGMMTADANKILADVAASGKQADYDALHADLMSITETTRRVLLDEGLITQDQFDAMEQQYGNYIPLRGFENVDAETGAIRPGIGRGINVRGKETIKALGRRSRAGDLIENVIRDYQRAVVRSEKNNVAKVLLDFVLSNPDPDLWGVDVDKTSASYNKAQGIVQYTKAIDKGEDTIGVKVGGTQVYIKLADKALTRALKQTFKEEVGDLERAAVAVSGWYTTLMRNVLTRYNPPFAMVNAIRDSQSGLLAATDELGAKGAARFSAHLPKAIAATTADETGWKSLSNPLTQQYLREFKAAGALTGGFYMRNLEDITKDLRNDLLKAGATPRTVSEKVKFNVATKGAYLAATKFLRALELAGAASENATRLALYMAARDMGKTPAQAALLAKNGTTNFNRKGEWGGALNAAYLFFNAAVQGNAQLIKTLKNPKVLAGLGAFAGAAMAMAFYGAAAGGEDDDGEKYWDKIPSYEKERNLIIMLAPGDTIGRGIDRVGKRGRYIKIPIQYGINFFPNLGYALSDVIRNAADPRQGKTPAKTGMHLASVFFGSMNPFGGALDLTDAVSVAMAVAPTVVDLPIQIGTERNSFGTPTAPNKMPGDNSPDSERMFVSQMGGVPEWLAKTLNELGGGNEQKPGKILGVETSVTPGTIKTIIAGTTGGLGTFFDQVITAGSGMASPDKAVKASNIPLVNKMYGEVDEGVNIRSANERMREVRETVKLVKDQVDAGIDPKMDSDEKRLVSIASAQKTFDKESRRLRKEEIAIMRSTTMTDEQKRLARDNIQAARDRMSTAVNRAYLDSLAGQKGSDQ